MVVYIRKRLNIFVCIPSGAGAEGEGWGVLWAGNRLWHAAVGQIPEGTPYLKQQHANCRGCWDWRQLAKMLLVFIVFLSFYCVVTIASN